MQNLTSLFQRTANASSVLIHFVNYDHTKTVVALENLRCSIPAGTSPVTWLSLAASTTLCYIIYSIFSLYRPSEIPVVGKRFELRAIKGWRFFHDAAAVLHEGYTKVGEHLTI